MDFETYKNQLLEYVTRYKNWWCEPYEQFHKDNKKDYKDTFSMIEDLDNYHGLVNKFRASLQKQYDLPEEIYGFLDTSYDVYIKVTHEQREEIRGIIRDSYHVSQPHFMEDLLMSYVDERARKKLRDTGDKIWLLRGLIAISMENCGTDFRDTLTQLVYLYIAAEEKSMNPEEEFQAIAKLSSHEEPRGGTEPMSKLMAFTRDSAYYRERTKSFSKR